MDEELYQAFITESEESITQLNNSLLSLESNPDDTEAIDDIFRQAHTLKGNFGAMGFDNAATVAHAVEDLLDEIRQGRLDVTPERMDLVFDGMDLIVEILHDIEENGESTIDPTDTVDEIRAAVESGAEEGNSNAASPDEADDDTEVDLVALAAETVDVDAVEAAQLTHARIELDAGDMAGVDAGIFLSGIPEEIDVAGMNPPRDAIENGEFDDGFDLFIAGDSPESVESDFQGLWKLSAIEATDVSEALDGDVEVEADTGADASETEQDTTDSPEDASDESADDDGGSAESDSTDESGSSSPSTTSGSKTETSDDDGDEKEETRSISAVKSVRVDVDQLDELHELVEQLVTSRIKLRNAIDEEQHTALDTLDELDKISSNLQNTVMDMRLIPLKKVFDKFPRLVRDLAREQDKRVSFKVEGEDIELDRTILDEISDPLMHVLRNAVDHGIEEPDVREANGKSRTGTIKLSARRQHDTVIVTVEDDGSGIDADAVRDKVVSEGVETREEMNAMPDSEVFDYIFHPGLSTNDEITDVSGRGVGMDVVKTTVESLDGSVSVESEPGEGSTVKIRLPVSVAIIKVLFVQVDDREFGVPIKYIDEISRRDRVQTVNGAEVIVHEDTIFPLIRLREALEIDSPDPDRGMVVRIRPDDRQVALHCDGVTKQEEVVVTPLQGPLSGVDGLSGTAVIGDGNVIPILDVSTLEMPDEGKRAMYEVDPTELPGSSEEAAD
ncbi:taxis sensor histidine kinase cheA / two-component system, chemotaxis family, sensor kinase CheA [Haloferax elongans ATCC BAA-1513]|uniref:Chemotaxis protein CheA n=1 Tax=Haloferax elongans ATCC BAA-1513 TaxID=1230453 RepID=M0HRU1_HALEO|nr:chemotaxis protein CheA [Haloferax elongans]ELZ85834.1 taxis sensor histidine kinase cheA / two-component system, chemotaxis family, sensor kinase CheA [Haloferax elongans ATCC BAA-1513]